MLHAFAALQHLKGYTHRWHKLRFSEMVHFNVQACGAGMRKWWGCSVQNTEYRQHSVGMVKWCGNDAQKSKQMVSGDQYTNYHLPPTDHHLPIW